jgi:hypothetical protein
VGGGVQTGPTWHVGHFWPIVTTKGDCEDGDFGGINIGRGNRNTRKKICHSATLSTTNPTWPEPGAGRRGEEPATNRLSYCAATVLSSSQTLSSPSVTCTGRADSGLIHVTRHKILHSWNATMYSGFKVQFQVFLLLYFPLVCFTTTYHVPSNELARG